MKEYKNKTIKIFDTEWKIKFLDKVYDDENHWVFGLSVGADRTLYVSLKDVNDKPLKDSEIQDTIIHEIIHAVLNTLCFFDVSNNEPAVEWLTKCLIQLEKQGIFKI
jgi:hypothetical protein